MPSPILAMLGEDTSEDGGALCAGEMAAAPRGTTLRASEEATAPVEVRTATDRPPVDLVVGVGDDNGTVTLRPDVIPLGEAQTTLAETPEGASRAATTLVGSNADACLCNLDGDACAGAGSTMVGDEHLCCGREVNDPRGTHAADTAGAASPAGAASAAGVVGATDAAGAAAGPASAKGGGGCAVGGMADTDDAGAI